MLQMLTHLGSFIKWDYEVGLSLEGEDPAQILFMQEKNTMLTAIPFLRIEEETPSYLTLTATDRRWLILFLTLFLVAPLFCMGVLFLNDRTIWLIGVASISFGLIVAALILLFTPYKAQLMVNANMLSITLNRYYWLGHTVREKSWFFSDFTDVNPVSQGWKNVVEFKSHGKKVLLLDFGTRGEDAQRSLHFMQSRFKGYNPESSAANPVLKEVDIEKQNQQILKNAEKLLNIFGIFSLIMGAMGLFTSNTLHASISLSTIVSFATGILYLTCGYGVKRRFEFALWVAILVVIGERLYWFIRSRSLSDGGPWSSWLTWIFAFFIVSSLWQAIRGIRATGTKPLPESL